MKMQNYKSKKDYFLTTNKKFFDKISPWYDIFCGNLTSRMQNKVIKSLDIDENAMVLDAGCGTGNLLSILEKSEKSLILYGIDISQKMLSIARKKLKTSNLMRVAVEDMQFKNFFDYAFSIDCFHHYADSNQSMKSLYLSLKQNGYLVVIDFNLGPFLNKLFQKIELGNSGIYSSAEIKTLFEKYEFKYVKQKKLGFFNIMTIGKK